jgi:uncharacterized protein
MKAVNSTNDRELATSLAVADSLPRRMIGLLGRQSLGCDEGLWIKSCNGIHTFGMKFPIDVLFLSKRHTVVGVRKRVVPNRMTPLFFSAASVVELPEGKIEETATKVGDLISFS